MSELTLYRGEVFDFIDSPLNRKDAYRYFPDGALVVREGEIVDCGPFEDIKGRYTDYELVDYSGKLLMPGFIDSHIGLLSNTIPTSGWNTEAAIW